MVLLSLALYVFSSASIVMIVTQLLRAGVVWFGLGFGEIASAEGEFNNPPGVEIWCGKAYRAKNLSFDPGGQLTPPTPGTPLPWNETRITVSLYAQYPYYTREETRATLIIDTPVSRYGGSNRFDNWTYDGEPNKRVPLTELEIYIRNDHTGEILVKWKRFAVNRIGMKVDVDISKFASGENTLLFFANSPDAIQSFQTQTQVTIVPERNDTGSMARLDRLNGGLQVRSSLTNDAWKNIFPFSFYTSWDWISSTLSKTSIADGKDLVTFRASGYNLVHPVPPGGSEPFDPVLFEKFLDLCDELELYIMYDMRHTYQNGTSITQQLSHLQSHPSLLLYYTADEPDGWCDPLNATSIAYNHIRNIDPYHPVSLVLNCANFHFGEYTSGADIILEDTYPIIKSSTFSPVYNTVCNSTYGDCGCDNCHVSDPEYPEYVINLFMDISERVDSLYQYQDWLPPSANPWRAKVKKPVWGVPQAFYDADSFWSRWPTAKEEAVMGLLRVNHGAMGIVAWIYPTSPEIEDVTSQLATLLTRPDITDLLLTAPRKTGHTSGAPPPAGPETVIETAAWYGEDEILVIILHLRDVSMVGARNFAALRENVEIEGGWEVLFGFVGWEWDPVVGAFGTEGLGALDVSILKAKIKK
ncbi:hypothetical protein K458DRAFT_481402 [Lentithecium fluviatile CBS 122367]|uniref:Uncharacterized protein n=1 Tax=Lentithecium fluviatile CBS 122367 TaxID=1168545 RepID=A0A6G1IGG9_9PLEO|nr:hypothetical protein K458DRAFT_481402 [Lentithecium fluviatile CBS 122367]